MGTSSDDYGLRLVRHMKDYSAYLIVDIDKEVVTDAISSIQVGKGTIAAIITTDGTELLSDGTNPEKPILQIRISIRSLLIPVKIQDRNM